MIDLRDTGGSYERQADATHVVSLWYIPHGSEYTDARVHTVFFSDKQAARSFEQKWSMPPEMAMILTVEQHDIVQAARLTQEPCSVCGASRNGHIDRIDARPGQCDTWVPPVSV